ncbi:2-hydroxychromene-2-carboxylate isomerase [Mesorhizobium sp. BAC0120]|uniref:2-hydroxychromene-2-carboxylate isomerase n=1 Tax=Mesorhizobium sp. BAC0120 TaxID=3090670 RepID=UPI00298CD42A|nr:2-hydroxychromene-2-carboxylate isomerase [Mesorhizobium sp. BAC0120]MDW6022519.1 2-hydroxychromene-2-carboxylate isomerase [Mesorhizobium sp. BAC0120]
MTGTSGPIEFWFEFSSPYAYFAALEIEELARRHGRSVAWRPFLLGVVFKLTKMAPLPDQSLRGDYAFRDWERLARLRGVPYTLPPKFPIVSLVPARMFYAAEQMNPEAAPKFALGLFDGLYAKGLDITDAGVAATLGASVGFDAPALVRSASDQRYKDALRARTDEAIGKGVFGSPFFIVDGEPFWGSDRLPMLEIWLSRGGW